MLKLLLACVLLVVAAGQEGGQQDAGHPECKVDRQGMLTSFSGETQQLQIYCKVHFIRGTKCGKWKLNLTPGFKQNGVGVYYIESLFVGIMNRKRGRSYEGRTEQDKLKMYFQDERLSAFNQLDGSLGLDEIVNVTKEMEDGKKTVKLTEKDNKDFEVKLELHDDDTTEFSFTCKNQRFRPREFPDQLCGTQAKNKVESYRIDNGLSDTHSALVSAVLEKEGIEQITPECEAAGKRFRNCRYDNEDLVADGCFRIFSSSNFFQCGLHRGENVPVPFKDCAECLCSKKIEPCEGIDDFIGHTNQDPCNNDTLISDLGQATYDAIQNRLAE